MFKLNKLKSFQQFLNEFEIEGEHQGKLLWNGKDYLDRSGDINLINMNLTELPVIFPEKWGGGFYCSYNKLTSLIGAPQEVGRTFDCSHNQLTSLDDAPGEVGGSFNCYNNKVKFMEEDVERVCNVEGKIYV